MCGGASASEAHDERIYHHSWISRVDVTAQNEIHIHVASTVEGAVCHRCGRDIQELYDYGREIPLKHLPILDRPTYIFIRLRRYVCRECGGDPTTTQRPPWYEPRSSVTRAYAGHILKQLVNSTVYGVSRKEKIGYDTVEDIVDREIAARRWIGGRLTGCTDWALTRFRLRHARAGRAWPARLSVPRASLGCLLRTNADYDITHWLAVIEPAVMALFKHTGVIFTPIGPSTHYMVLHRRSAKPVTRDSGKNQRARRRLAGLVADPNAQLRPPARLRREVAQVGGRVADVLVQQVAAFGE